MPYSSIGMKYGGPVDTGPLGLTDDCCRPLAHRLVAVSAGNQGPLGFFLVPRWARSILSSVLLLSRTEQRLFIHYHNLFIYIFEICDAPNCVSDSFIFGTIALP
ncbi:hypothetical protein XELAEV_18036022mg [Xenopus laevis]|uniref:Uncharacterized protein n=1 Tax=Xenopus laevis TaxID=8355 RepID=A0A974CGN1_XENLA|nr:hypothetical protein XELAEV_18036022mg [Xenopus laevis]